VNKLQIKYNMLHFLYWFTTCSINGFTAIFLRTKGLNNSEIGLTVGIGAVFSILVSPFLSAIIVNTKWMTIRKMIVVIYTTSFLVYLLMLYSGIPILLIMMMYVLLFSIVMSVGPFLSVIFLDYTSDGRELNYGLARGFGSISYALAAIIIGQLCVYLNPNVLVIVFVISGSLFLILLFFMPDCKVRSRDDSSKARGALVTVVKTYKAFILFLIAYSLVQGASNSLGTYLIYFVQNLGGNTAIYGVSIFCMAASEMPVMAIAQKLLMKISCEKLLTFSLICYIGRNFTICIAGNIVTLIIGLMFQSISYGLFTAVITYYITRKLLPEYNLMGQAWFNIFSIGVSSAIGCLLGGILMDSYGISGIKIFTYILTASGAILAVFTYLYSKSRELND